MIHLICGPIGSGKTTYAIDLAKDLGALRFSEDEWLANMHIPLAPEGLMDESMAVIGEWASERYALCRDQIWQLAKQALALGLPVIFDGAGANQEQRDAFRHKALTLNVDFTLHILDAPADIRWQRVQSRNLNQGPSYSMDVPEKVFTAMEQSYQKPSPEEIDMAQSIQVSLK